MGKILIIVGPTAIGKSDLALKLALELKGEIINADSMQVYQEMSIGTAKPDLTSYKNIKHHLYSIRSVKELFSVADFQKEITSKVEEVINRGNLPIIVGGTGLYIRAFLYGYKFDDYKQDQTRLDLDVKTNAELLAYLRAIDPVSAVKIHMNNRKRLIRAITIFENIGKAKSELEDLQSKKPMYDAQIIGLTMSREKLYERINQRVDKMIKDGLKQEAQNVIKLAPPRSTALQAIGYKEFKPYFTGEVSLEKVRETIQKNTRNYAKRQYTFFRNQLQVNWFDLEKSSLEEIKNKIIFTLSEGSHGKT
jgi:tRNA dimethylallyltransferase